MLPERSAWLRSSKRSLLRCRRAVFNGRRAAPEEADPVAEQDGGRRAGAVIWAHDQTRQLRGQHRLAQSAGPRLEALQDVLRRGIEIVQGNGRIIEPLAGEKACDVAHIFPLQ